MQVDASDEIESPSAFQRPSSSIIEFQDSGHEPYFVWWIGIAHARAYSCAICRRALAPLVAYWFIIGRFKNRKCRDWRTLNLEWCAESLHLITSGNKRGLICVMKWALAKRSLWRVWWDSFSCCSGVAAKLINYDNNSGKKRVSQKLKISVRPYLRYEKLHRNFIKISRRSPVTLRAFFCRESR